VDSNHSPGLIRTATSVIERLFQANRHHNIKDAGLGYSSVEGDRNFDDRGDCALNKVVL